MSVEDKLDNIADSLTGLKQDHKDLHKKVDRINNTNARLDERTQQHEKRMNRMDKKATTLGGLTGGSVAAIITVVKSLLWPHNG